MQNQEDTKYSTEFWFSKTFSFNLGKKFLSEYSRFKVGFSLSFSNLHVSEIIYEIALP